MPILDFSGFPSLKSVSIAWDVVAQLKSKKIIDPWLSQRLIPRNIWEQNKIINGKSKEKAKAEIKLG